MHRFAAELLVAVKRHHSDKVCHDATHFQAYQHCQADVVGCGNRRSAVRLLEKNGSFDFTPQCGPKKNV